MRRAQAGGVSAELPSVAPAGAPVPEASEEPALAAKLERMVVSETIHVMLLTRAKWQSFTKRPIPPTNSSEVMLALSCDSREAVDVMNEAAAAHGGKADINPVQDLGFMYNRNLVDPDGHVWEAMFMDMKAMPTA
jgi:uncharacterized protein